jgi:GNAT superfamily N-acetyltransferase
MSGSWRVRAATHDDVPPAAVAVRELLVELGGTPPPTSAMEAAARALLDDRNAGTLLVAQADGALVETEADGAIIGVLGASWQTAIHVPGRYALIQDLWVHRSWRGRAIGRGLLKALIELTHELQIARVEVGLPREGYAGLAATEAFYLGNGFTQLGPRMRRILA